VAGGGGLMAGFPLAYGIILPALYAPLIAMLLALVFRGVAFEFRWRDPGHRAIWDAGFSLGSIAAALAQGITLGAILQGIRVEHEAYAGGWLDWLSPFSVLTGVSLVIGYGLLGATWLIWKTEDDLQDRAYRIAVRAGLATLALMAAVSLYNLALLPQYRERWLEMPNILFASQVPLLTAIIAAVLFYGLHKRWQLAPFVLALLLFLLGMAGLGVTIWPYVVPGALTIWDTAAPEASQVFMLVGAVITLPLILGYTAWSYWVFRGKVGTEGYH
jgi:cytochrome d ubiquinol oxidase subunit II